MIELSIFKKNKVKKCLYMYEFHYENEGIKFVDASSKNEFENIL